MDKEDYQHLKLRLHTSADLYTEDVRRDWLIHKGRMSQTDSLAHRIAAETGAGRTRVEANTPAATQTIGG